MVQVVENWADVQAEVRSVRSAPDLPSHVIAEMHVDAVTAVAGFPNLLADTKDTVIEVRVPKELAHERGLAAGSKVKCRLRLGGPQRIFAHPDRFDVD